MHYHTGLYTTTLVYTELVKHSITTITTDKHCLRNCLHFLVRSSWLKWNLSWVNSLSCLWSPLLSWVNCRIQFVEGVPVRALLPILPVLQHHHGGMPAEQVGSVCRRCLVAVHAASSPYAATAPAALDGGGRRSRPVRLAFLHGGAGGREGWGGGLWRGGGPAADREHRSQVLFYWMSYHFAAWWYWSTCFSCNNNNNNIAFFSQASWGRLEMKPERNKFKV